MRQADTDKSLNWVQVCWLTFGLVAMAAAAWWWPVPDLPDRVRLTAPGQTAKPSTVPTESASTPGAPCTQADLDTWQLPSPPDAAAQYASLYSDQAGARRVRQGHPLGQGVIVQSITASQVILACAGQAERRTLFVPIVTPHVAPVSPLGN